MKADNNFYIFLRKKGDPLVKGGAAAVKEYSDAAHTIFDSMSISLYSRQLYYQKLSSFKGAITLAHDKTGM